MAMMANRAVQTGRWSRLLPLLLALAVIPLWSGCRGGEADQLPVIGTVSREFSFKNQEGREVTAETFRGRVYVTDFFFTSCPSICPIMKRQMVRVYQAFEGNPEVLLLSHTIDPEHDTVEVLNNYAEGLGIDSRQWHLVTGDQDEIFAMAKHYMLGVLENEEAPGGYIHSGSFVLVDKDSQIRGYYDGTDEDAVDLLIGDLREMIDAD